MSPLLRAQEPTHVAHGPVRTDYFSLVFPRVYESNDIITIIILV